MKDFHSHICYGIDDGSNSLEESINILKTASSEGITDILLTPHYIVDSPFNTNNRRKNEILKNLQKECKKENININLYLGNEIFINENILDLINKKEIMPLNNSKYLLIELSVFQEYPNTKAILFELIRKDYIPVIAHPERYIYIDSKLEYIKELKNMGCLFQGNYQSLFNKYGRTPKKMLKKMLKANLIDFLGSDIHHEENFNIEKLKKKLKRIVKDDNKIELLLNENFNKII